MCVLWQSGVKGVFCDESQTGGFFHEFDCSGVDKSDFSVQFVHLVIPNIGLNNQPFDSGLREMESQNRSNNRKRKSTDGLTGRRDQKVHTPVTRLDIIMLTDLIMRRIIGFNKKSWSVLMVSKISVRVTTVLQICVELFDAIQAMVAHIPESGVFLCEPTVQKRAIGTRIECLQGQVTNVRMILQKNRGFIVR